MNILLESNIGRISLVIQPVTANNTDGARSLLNVRNDLSTFLGRKDIRILNALAFRQRINNPVDCA